MKRTGMRLMLILTALVGLPGVAGEAAAQRLGRLFTSVDERASLDTIRYEAQFARQQAAPEPEPEPQLIAPVASQPRAPAVSRLTINGVVRRSRGPGTVWVNGDRVQRGETTREGIAVDSARSGAGGVRLRLPSGTDTVALRPGQQIDIESGTVVEAYEKSARGEQGSAFAPAGDAGTAPSPSAAAPDSAAPPPGQALSAEQRQRLVDDIRRSLEEAQQRPGAGATSATAPGS